MPKGNILEMRLTDTINANKKGIMAYEVEWLFNKTH